MRHLSKLWAHAALLDQPMYTSSLFSGTQTCQRSQVYECKNFLPSEIGLGRLLVVPRYVLGPRTTTADKDDGANDREGADTQAS